MLKQISGGQVKDFHLSADRIFVGRHPECEIVIDDHAVSRKHFQFTLVDSAYWIEDLKSHNGTYLNGKKLSDAVLLAEGDEISFCDYMFRFYDEASIDMGHESGLVFQ